MTRNKEKRVYLYPVTTESVPVIGNNYISFLITSLERENFVVVNKKPTKLGLVDLLTKMWSCDFIYFNWIEDLPDKRFGYFQVFLLALIIFLSKLINVRIVWFVHDNLSHTKQNLNIKKSIRFLMYKTADIILAHTTNVRYSSCKNFFAFDHPMDKLEMVTEKNDVKYDLVIWGRMLEYKGIREFVAFYAKSKINALKVLIAGEFTSQRYYDEVMHYATENVNFINNIITEEELKELFSQSRYVLFTYNSPSVLSSAALCKTLAMGKEILGPNIGSFKEFGDKQLIHTYNSFSDLEKLLLQLRDHPSPIDFNHVNDYITKTTWPMFGKFLSSIMVGTRN